MFLPCWIYTAHRNPRSGSQNSALRCHSGVIACHQLPTPRQSQTLGLLTAGDAVAPEVEPAPLLRVLILSLPPGLLPRDLWCVHWAKKASRPLQGYQTLALNGHQFLGTPNATWSTNQKRGLQESGDRWSLNSGGQFSGPGGPWTHSIVTSSMPEFIIRIDTHGNWHSHW